MFKRRDGGKQVIFVLCSECDVDGDLSRPLVMGTMQLVQEKNPEMA